MMSASQDYLQVEIIESLLRSQRIGRQVIVFAETDSTSDIAWAYRGTSHGDGTAVFAEYQRAGRGRRDNRWQSERGKSVLCSVLLEKLPDIGDLFTFAAAVAAAHAVEESTDLHARLKWPNDVVIGNRKTAGILLESRRNNSHCDIVIGIGINCNQDREQLEAKSFDKPATSLAAEAGKPVNRNQLAASLLSQLDRWIRTARTGRIEILEQWKRLSSQLGHRVVLENRSQRFAGQCIGIDPVEGLILQLEGGGIRHFESAYTTIVGG